MINEQYDIDYNEYDGLFTYTKGETRIIYTIVNNRISIKECIHAHDEDINNIFNELNSEEA